MTLLAFDLSERFDVPVLVRSSTRVSHAKSPVEMGEGAEAPARDAYATNTAKWVMMPAMAKQRRVAWDQRLEDMAEYAETVEVNRIELRSPEIGIVTSGVSYEHVREALPDASTLKLGMSFPLPGGLIRDFASRVDAVYVVEEAGDFLARTIRSLGVELAEAPLPRAGELTPGAVRRAFGLPDPPLREAEESLPPRPPLMCPGCPHRPVFNALRKLRAVVTGDIGCYTLGALAPLSAMDSCVCMGASIGMGHGMELAGGVEKRPVVAVIGDSTFAHSGVTGLMNTAYNRGGGTVLILDNRITAMTGHQGNPVNGITLGGAPSVELDLPKLAEAIGISRVRVEDPHDLAGVEAALKEEIAAEELSVIVFRAPCALLLREEKSPFGVDDDACTACGVCIKLGCPAIAKTDSGKAFIDTSVCVGCGQCVQVCRYDAIVPSGPACDFGGGL
jgi:indolepyruvate ferredoxin oxidoreductase alpha subunit